MRKVRKNNFSVEISEGILERQKEIEIDISEILVETQK